MSIMSVCIPCMLGSHRGQRQGIEARRENTSLRTGFADFCEPSYGCWELTLGPLQKQVLSNTERSL